MDPLSVASTILKTLELAVQVAHFVVSKGQSYRAARFGSAYGYLHDLLSTVSSSATKSLQDTHWKINCWKDEEVMTWKASYVASLNAVSVAGAIFASVGATALQLPNLDACHWTARAFLSSSMAVGIMAVMSATALQQEVGRLNDALQIRLWLSHGRPKHTYDRPSVFQYQLMPLESSASALQASEMPNNLLILALALFLIGFGLYLIFSWVNKVEGDGVDARNVFIFFICAVGLLYALGAVVQLGRDFDSMKVRDDFHIGTKDAFSKSKEQVELEQLLTAFQQSRSTGESRDRDNVRVKQIIDLLVSRISPDSENSSFGGSFLETRLRDIGKASPHESYGNIVNEVQTSDGPSSQSQA